MKTLRFGTFLLLIFIFSCKQKGLTLKLTNPLNIERPAEFVVLKWSKMGLPSSLSASLPIKITSKGEQIPYQILNEDELGIVLNFLPSETRKVHIFFNTAQAPHFKSRAHAEISVRQKATFDGQRWKGGFFKSVPRLTITPSHFVHDEWIRFEGPGWESDKIAYRLYLDERNAIDVFGKHTQRLILPFVGHDTSQTYHKMNWWGMDVLKVGKTFGVGSFAFYRKREEGNKQNEQAIFQLFPPLQTDSIRCTILEDGPLRAGVELVYYGWQVGPQTIDVRARHFITAGQYLTRHEIEIVKGQAALVLGVMKPSTAALQTFEGEGFAQMVTGIQSLAGDSLAVFWFLKERPINSVLRVLDGNVLLFLSPQNTKITFWSGALWQANFSPTSFTNVCQTFGQTQARRLQQAIQIQY